MTWPKTLCVWPANNHTKKNGSRERERNQWNLVCRLWDAHSTKTFICWLSLKLSDTGFSIYLINSIFTHPCTAHNTHNHSPTRNNNNTIFCCRTLCKQFAQDACTLKCFKSYGTDFRFWFCRFCCWVLSASYNDCVMWHIDMSSSPSRLRWKTFRSL